MGKWRTLLLAVMLCGSAAPAAARYDPLVFVHYMPWYQSKDFSGYWGWHWTMNTRDPERAGADGRREIASHFYPLVGPYDSSDPALIEYHLILMKLSGIDGLFIDWYGVHNVRDYPVIRQAVETLVRSIEKTDLKFAIVYEDRTVASVMEETGAGDPAAVAAEDLAYLERRFFSHPNYLRVDGSPVLLNFGPIALKDPSDWNRAFEALSGDVTFLVLNGHSRTAAGEPSPFDGEFGWVRSPEATRAWYRSGNLGLQIGPVLPGYRDFYVEGGVYSASLNHVPANGGETFRRFLQLAEEEEAPILQVITWNDFGEGTNIEPTLEYGYEYLLELQRFTGAPYGLEELRLAEAFYVKRKGAKEVAAQLKLTEAFRRIMEGDVEAARALIAEVE